MNVRNLGLALAACATAALMAGSANAGILVKYYGYGAGAPSLSTLTNFSSGFALPPGFSWSGTGSIVTGSVLKKYAAPALGPASNLDKGPYLAVMKGKSETLKITKPGVEEIGIYAGSADTFNKVVVDYGLSSVASFIPRVVSSGLGDPNGNDADRSGLFLIKTTAPITSITFSSSDFSFEIADLSIVPEPSAWVMLILGFAMMGVALRRRSGAPALAA